MDGKKASWRTFQRLPLNNRSKIFKSCLIRLSSVDIDGHAYPVRIINISYCQIRHVKIGFQHNKRKTGAACLIGTQRKTKSTPAIVKSNVVMWENIFNVAADERIRPPFENSYCIKKLKIDILRISQTLDSKTWSGASWPLNFRG